LLLAFWRLVGWWVEMLEEMRRAAVVAIPIRLDPFGIVGLTELNSALSLGKPVVMSRNNYIDLNPEKLGFGLCMDHGDDAKWVSTIQELLV
jgi:glycosyltransferase involved in cell wall biosynthesis